MWAWDFVQVLNFFPLCVWVWHSCNVQLSNLPFWTQSKASVWTYRNSYPTPSWTAVTLCMVWQRQGSGNVSCSCHASVSLLLGVFLPSPKVGEKLRGCGQTQAGSRLNYWCLAMLPFLVSTAATAAISVFPTAFCCSNQQSVFASLPSLGEPLSVGPFEWLPSGEN